MICEDYCRTNRYMSYVVSKEILKKFFEKHISRLDMQKQCDGGFVYIEDFHQTYTVNHLITEIKHLPTQYLSPADAYFDEDIIDEYSYNQFDKFFNNWSHGEIGSTHRT